jgi:TatD DNase family protein
MRYFNIHRHSPAKDLEETAIINIFPKQEVPGNHLYSVGLHPWYVFENVLNRDLKLVEQKGVNAAAIGECGLDRSCDLPFELQLNVLRAQVEIAAALVKPLIIHCVRAYPELIAEKKKYGDKLAWIVHGFRGYPEMASQLIDHGLYLSFGEALLRDRHLGAILASVPEDRYFLETDESSLSIGEIYGKAALLRKTDIETILLQQRQNAASVFGDDAKIPYFWQ